MINLSIIKNNEILHEKANKIFIRYFKMNFVIYANKKISIEYFISIILCSSKIDYLL